MIFTSLTLPPFAVKMVPRGLARASGASTKVRPHSHSHATRARPVQRRCARARLRPLPSHPFPHCTLPHPPPPHTPLDGLQELFRWRHVTDKETEVGEDESKGFCYGCGHGDSELAAHR